MKDKCKLFCRNVLTILRDRGIKIGEFEDAIGVCRGYISRQAHDGLIRLDTAMTIAAALKMPVEDIFEFDAQTIVRRKKQEKLDRLLAEVAELRKELE